MAQRIKTPYGWMTHSEIIALAEFGIEKLPPQPHDS